MWDSRRSQLLLSHVSRQKLIPLAIRTAALSAFVVGAIIAEPRSAHATKFWKNSVVTGNWSNGNNWSASSAAGLDNAGAPVQSEVVNIVNTDGTARSVTYDVNAPALGFGPLSIDLTGPGTTTNTYSLTTNNSFASGGLNVGGYNGIVGTAGRGTFTQTAGSVSMNSGLDITVGYGAGSTGVYNLNSSGGTGTIIASQSEYIGLNGTGIFSQGAGTNTVAAGTVGALDLGAFSGSHGTYNLSGGMLSSSKSEYVGDSGTGAFNQTGGTNITNFNSSNSTTSSLYLGFSNGGNGSYTASSSALLSVNGDVNVGNSGTGVGTLTVQDQAIVNIANTLVINNHGAVNLNGGTLRFNLYTKQPAGAFNYNAGTIRLANIRTIGSDSTITSLFGASPSIPTGKGLFIEGTVAVDTNTIVNGGTLTSLQSSGIGNAAPGSLQITNGGTVQCSSFSVGFGFAGTATIAGAGSNLTASDVLSVGIAAAGTLTISPGGVAYAGNAFINGTNGTINLSGGTIRMNTYSSTGTFNYQSGTIQLAGDRQLGTDAIVSTVFGATPTIDAGKTLAVEGTATLPGQQTLVLNGGALAAPMVIVSTSGRINSTQSSSQVVGAILALPGSVLDATGGDLLLGDATKPNGFYSNGALTVGSHTVTLADANDAVFDSAALVSLGSGASPGALSATNGLTIDFGGNVAGFGTITTPNTLAKPLINNGHIAGNSGAQLISLSGYVKGVGTFDNVNFTGTFSPGLSPTMLAVGNVALSPTSTLVMELGGTTRGSAYDAIVASGNLSLAGALQLSLISGFAPAAGNSFDILDWESLSGTFSSLALPSLTAGLTWNTSQLYSTGVLSVASPALPGDYNNNGVVDAADYVVWRKGLGTVFTQNDYDVWRAHFGQTAGSGSGANVNVAVPEPTTLLQIFLLAAVLSACRRRSASHVPKLINA